MNSAKCEAGQLRSNKKEGRRAKRTARRKRITAGEKRKNSNMDAHPVERGKKCMGRMNSRRNQ